MNTATPPVGHPFKLKGNNSPIPLQNEGVARSDGVVAFESVAQSDAVVNTTSNHKLNDLPYNPVLKQRAKELRKAGNLSEVLFWSAVKNQQLNDLDFDRQRVIGNYIVDFYCHEYALVVEIDGSSHDDKQEYDLARDQYLEALGLNVLHVLDSEVKQNLAAVLDLVRMQIQIPLPRRFAPPLHSEGELKPAKPHIERTPNTATPPVGHPFKLKGNNSPIPLQFEGVAPSDGVADFNEVAASDSGVHSDKVA